MGIERETLSQLLGLRDVAISGPVEGIWGDVERQPWFYYCCDLGHRARADYGNSDPFVPSSRDGHVPRHS